MKRVIAYTTLALVTFVCVIVVFAPAATLWNLVKNDVSRRIQDLQVLTVDGTVWQGDAMLRYREFPPAKLAWDLSPLSLFRQQAVIVAELNGEGLAIDSNSVIMRSGLVADGNGVINSSYINAVSTRYGLTFPGELIIRNLDIQSDFRWISDIDGRLSWGGGQVLLQYAEPMVVQLPPLEAILSKVEGNNLLMDVTHAGDTVIQVTLRPTGWAIVDIRARLFDLAGLPRPERLQPENSAALLEEKIF
jgi:hypothetical protein